ncbi:MAG: hypothetical protein AAF587_43900 [Bacteroidota bacterium]
MNFPIIAQVEKVYDEDERLQTVNPLNESGVWEGVGYSFHPNGGVSKETPFVKGRIIGEEKEFYENGNLRSLGTYIEGVRDGVYVEYFNDGTIKLRQEWEMGIRQGELTVFDEDGNLSMYAILDHDSVVFAQRFNDQGNLISERLGFVEGLIDTTNLEEPHLFIKEGNQLQRDTANQVSIFFPKVPSKFVEYSSPDGTISSRGASIEYPLVLTPYTDGDEFRLYLRVKVRSEAQATFMRTIRIPVK